MTMLALLLVASTITKIDIADCILLSASALFSPSFASFRCTSCLAMWSGGRLTLRRSRALTVTWGEGIGSSMWILIRVSREGSALRISWRFGLECRWIRIRGSVPRTCWLLFTSPFWLLFWKFQPLSYYSFELEWTSVYALPLISRILIIFFLLLLLHIS